MTMIQINYSDIPAYLHAGEFYRSLDSEDPEGIIEVPADCYQQDGEIAADLEEFRQLLRVMAFWMLDDIPLGVLKFCNEHEVNLWTKGITDLPGALKQEMHPLLLTAYSEPDSIPFGDIIETGRWDLIKHAVSLVSKSGPSTTTAAYYGNLRLLQYLHEHGFQWSADVCKEAAFSGQLRCLQYAHENGCPWDSETTKCAAQEGHVDCLAYAHETDCPWNAEVYLIAAKHGHLNSVQYAFSRGLEWHVDVCKEAALKGHLHCLQYAHENGCPWDSETTKCAAQEGHIFCLMYALEHGCPVDQTACNLACKHGHLECLQLLHQFGAPWDECVPFHAAMCPTIDCLQYLHENGCPWDKDTPHQAAYNGHIEPLRYALEHGCLYPDEFVAWAAHGTSVECLQYTVEDQLLQMDEEAFLVALVKGDLACLQYLLDQGCPYIDAEFPDDTEEWEKCDNIYRKGNPEFVLCVEYAVERGWELCRNFVQYIVTRDEPCKQWLISEGLYIDPNNDEREANVGSQENTGVYNVKSVGGVMI